MQTTNTNETAEINLYDLCGTLEEIEAEMAETAATYRADCLARGAAMLAKTDAYLARRAANRARMARAKYRSPEKNRCYSRFD